MPVNVAALPSALTDAWGKLGKPSFKSPTWWFGAATTVFGCLVTVGVLGNGAVLTVAIGGALAIGSSLAMHWKDGKVKMLLGAIPQIWDLWKAVHATSPAVLAATLPVVSPSLRPTEFMPPVSKEPGAVPQAKDAEEPRR